MDITLPGPFTTADLHLVWRFLHQLAAADGALHAEELRLLELARANSPAGDPAVDLTRPLDATEREHLAGRLRADRTLGHWLVTLAMRLVNSDGAFHERETEVFFELISAGDATQRRELVRIADLDDTTRHMVTETRRLCEEKGAWWQGAPKHPGAQQKRVAASLSFVDDRGTKRFVTGMNYELSTPSGSRCAEQNAIGVAIANYPTLRFDGIREVLVYGGGAFKNPLYPCGVCIENLRKINVNKQISVLVFHESDPGALWRVPLDALDPRA